MIANFNLLLVFIYPPHPQTPPQLPLLLSLNLSRVKALSLDLLNLILTLEIYEITFGSLVSIGNHSILSHLSNLGDCTTYLVGSIDLAINVN